MTNISMATQCDIVVTASRVLVPADLPLRRFAEQTIAWLDTIASRFVAIDGWEHQLEGGRWQTVTLTDPSQVEQYLIERIGTLDHKVDASLRYETTAGQLVDWLQPDTFRAEGFEYSARSSANPGLVTTLRFGTHNEMVSGDVRVGLPLELNASADEVLALLIEYWRPQYAEITERELATAVHRLLRKERGRQNRNAQLDRVVAKKWFWDTALLDGLPDGVEQAISGQGLLITATGEIPSAIDDATLERALALSDVLDARLIEPVRSQSRVHEGRTRGLRSRVLFDGFDEAESVLHWACPWHSTAALPADLQQDLVVCAQRQIRAAAEGETIQWHVNGADVAATVRSRLEQAEISPAALTVIDDLDVTIFR